MKRKSERGVFLGRFETPKLAVNLKVERAMKSLCAPGSAGAGREKKWKDLLFCH